jgi:hypothetical protein
MKRIGTISSAAGLIFLGVWMIISRTNAAAGAEVFKWWPIIIVLVGVEILIHFSKKEEGARVGFNWIIIPVVLIFLSVNVVQGVTGRFNKFAENNGFSMESIIEMAENMDFDIKNSRIIESTATMPIHGERLNLSVDNGKINIIKSDDNNIRINARVFVRNTSSINKYEITADKNSDGYKINFDNDDIRKVEADIYIPDKYNIKLDCDNLSLKGGDNLNNSGFEINGDNVNVNLSSINNLKLDFDNGNVKLLDVDSVNMTGDNANADIKGKAENINLSFSNGKVDVQNDLCKNVNIELDRGAVDLNTQDKNLDVRIELDQGVARINELKQTNSIMEKTFGSGEGKVKIRLDQGSVAVSHKGQE